MIISPWTYVYVNYFLYVYIFANHVQECRPCCDLYIDLGFYIQGQKYMIEKWKGGQHMQATFRLRPVPTSTLDVNIHEHLHACRISIP